MHMLVYKDIGIIGYYSIMNVNRVAKNPWRRQFFVRLPLALSLVPCRRSAILLLIFSTLLTVCVAFGLLFSRTVSWMVDKRSANIANIMYSILSDSAVAEMYSK